MTTPSTLRAHVTGASRGIGHAAARALAQSGVRLSLSSRSLARASAAATELGTSERAVDAFELDLTRPESVADFLRVHSGELDVLVYNAGGPTPGDVDGVSSAAWDEAYRSLLESYRTLLQAFVPAMAERGFGRVIVIGSQSVFTLLPGLHLSNVFRPAVAALTKSYADRYGGRGVTCNVVCPGGIDTERVQTVLARRARDTARSLESIEQDYLAAIPAGRLGKPQEVGDLVCFLASRQASFINGACIAIDGGGARAF